MNKENIAFWIDYVGGVDIIWLIGASIAFTQLVKPLVPVKYRGYALRSISMLTGSFSGLILLEFSSRGAMVGMTCGALSAILWFATSTYLEAGSWAKAAPLIAKRMRGEQ